jgi:N-sulfoglucosamine sulfohydrolase
MQDTLIHLRKVLDNWIEETNDLGRYPEKELIEMWLSDGVQPKLKPLQLDEKGGKINLIANKSDATIIWKKPGDVNWMIFSEPLGRNISFVAKAVRIGYTDSDELVYSSD